MLLGCVQHSLSYDHYHHLPPGFLSLRKEEPLPELFPQTLVSSYSWPHRTQVADKVVSPSCFRSSLRSFVSYPVNFCDSGSTCISLRHSHFSKLFFCAFFAAHVSALSQQCWSVALYRARKYHIYKISPNTIDTEKLYNRSILKHVKQHNASL